MTLDELNTIKSEIFKDADNKYVQIDDCNDKQQSINKKLANDDKRIELLVAKISGWEKILWVIATTSVGALVTAIIELIFK